LPEREFGCGFLVVVAMWSSLVSTAPGSGCLRPEAPTVLPGGGGRGCCTRGHMASEWPLVQPCGEKKDANPQSSPTRPAVQSTFVARVSGSHSSARSTTTRSVIERRVGIDRTRRLPHPQHHPWLRDQRDHAIIVGCNDEEISRVSDGGRL